MFETPWAGEVMSGLAILASLMAAVPIMAEPIGEHAHALWVRNQDLPRVHSDHPLVTRYDLSLDAGGRPFNCFVTESSGMPEIDVLVCDALMKRARFTPARDSLGTPLPSLSSGRIIYDPDGVGGNSLSDGPPNIVVFSPLITPHGRARRVEIVEVLDATGGVEECMVTKRSDIETLNQRACETVAKSGLARPIIDPSGTASKTVRQFMIAFLPKG